MVRVEFIVKRLRILTSLTVWLLLLAATSLVHAQARSPLPMPSGTGPLPKVLDRYPENPSLSPAFTIAARPLGFSVPGENYLLRRESLVSLDFLDEDRILFSFRVPRLMQRDAANNSGDKKQEIQALVLSLPSGKIEARATWTVPDRSRYLWMLNDGHFLLRVADGLDEGDVQLQMKPKLRAPGRLLWIEMDPKQQVMITNSLEPANVLQKADESRRPGPNPGGASQSGANQSGANPGDSGAPVTEPTDVTKDGQKPDEQSVLVARTEKLESGEVMLEKRVPWTNQRSDWPMNSDGYLETSHDKADQWLLKLNSFSGGSQVLTHIESFCPPQGNFVSESELLLMRCDPDSGWTLRAITTRGDSLWDARTAMNAMVPLLVAAPNGLRVARETMLLKRSVDKYKRKVGMRDFQGQMVKVFNAADGKMVLEAPLTPIFDGGGNVAVSPSGQRVAILNAGAIQVFQLPAAPAVPGSH
jgi:hypothetical protein